MKYSGPAVKLSSLTKLLAEQQTLLIGAGIGMGAIVLLAILWTLLGGGGISEAMRYLPNDCLVVGTANVDEWLNSSFCRQLKKDVPSFEDGERSLEQDMGIAPANISRVTFAVGGKLDSPGDADLVLVIRLKKAVSATDIKSNTKVNAFKKDVKYEETKIGGVDVYEETYRFNIAGDNAKRQHGEAFCLPESTLLLACSKLEVLKTILERGKSPEFSTGMRNAMKEANFSKTAALAVNIKGLMASEAFAREIKNLGGVPHLKALENLTDETFQQNLLGLAVDAGLDSSHAKINAVLLCKDAKFALDAQKILEGGQVVVRNALKAAHGVPREVPDMVDAIKFGINGAVVRGSLQTSLEPLSKWIKEQAEKK